MSVETVLNLGDDAFANKFLFVLPEGLPAGGDSDSVSLRMDQSFDPPEEMVGTYELKMRGATVIKTNANEQTSKELTVDIRVDREWKVFKDLRNTFLMTYDAKKGTALSDLATRFKFAIHALDGEENIITTFMFNFGKIKGLKASTFDNGSDDPVRVTVSLIYGSMDVI